MAASVFSHIRDSKNSFTVGGMRSKLKSIRISVKAGIPVFLADGRDPDILHRLFKGEDVGTLFMPDVKDGRKKKDWLKTFVENIEDKNENRNQK